ncbi:MAG: methyltransferase domain-containing protein [Candidatus Bathyarchaeota archaeon]|nr:methyltransferase domain-containing protein [Candidatus Termiticorpusculum sp.]
MKTAKSQSTKAVRDKIEIMRGYNLIMSKIYNFLTLYLLSTLITKAHKTLLETAKPRSHDILLDVGCGTGTQLIMLRKKLKFNGKICAVDLSKSMLKIAKKRLNKENNVNLILADAEHLPFKTKTFTLGTCAGVIRFLPDPEKMFIEVYRVLNMESVFVLREFAGTKKAVIEIQHFPLPFQKRFTVWRIRSDNQIQQLMHRAGFVDISLFRRGKIPHVPIAMGNLYRTTMFAKGKKLG